MDALDLLEQQHRKLAELLADLVADGSAAGAAPRGGLAPAGESAGRRTALIAQLVRTVEAHSRVEETVFYAAFGTRVAAEPKLYEAYEAHALLRFAAVNLLHTRATDVRFAARLKLVHDLFERHAALKKDWMFPKAKRVLHDEVLDRIGVDLERAHASRLSVSPPMPERLRARRLRPRSPLPERRALLY